MNNYSFIVNLTHDIDFVRKTYQYITHDLVRLKVKNLRKVFNKKDPYWTFDQIMSIEERVGCRSTFFFLEESFPLNPFAVSKWNLALGKYKFSEKPIKKMIRQLDREEWEIGLHGSYHSYYNKDLLAKEKNNLEESLGKSIHGVRQHFLNLNIPDTWLIQKQLGFLYDASFGKKCTVGFIDNHFLPFINKESGMVVIPIALMDAYLSPIVKYDMSKAWKLILKIIDVAEENKAVLSILWHNNFFNENEHPGFSKLYDKLLWECKNRGAKFLTSHQVYEQFSINKSAVNYSKAGIIQKI